MDDLTTPEGVAAHMKATSPGSSEDWDKRALEVLNANGGNYPSFWWEAVMVAGIHRMVMGAAGGITVVNIHNDGSTTETTYDPVTGARMHNEKDTEARTS